MRVLVVGAGAVGQTFAYHLQRGGADVAFLVKPKYADDARSGFTLYDLGAGGRTEPLSFTGFEVLTSADEVRDQTFDAVLITVSSTALTSGTWLTELVEASGDATICGMQPGLGDQERVQELAGADRVVWGLIELIAYQAPLEGEQVPRPGIAFWIPWPLFFPFSGPVERTDALVQAFHAGGLRARRQQDVATTTALGGSWLNLHVAALESVGWSFAALSRDRELLATTSKAVKQAIAASAHDIGVRTPWWTGLLAPWQVRLLLWASPKLIPLDVETYFRFHFTKVGEQTRELLERWIEAAERASLPNDALKDMRRTA